MIIPEECYHEGLIYVSEAEAAEAKEEASKYNSGLGVVAGKQKKMRTYRSLFLIVSFFYIAIVGLVFPRDLFHPAIAYAADIMYALVTLFFVLVKKNPVVPAIVSVILLLTMKWAIAIIAVLALLAYLHEGIRKELKDERGYPEFKEMQVRVNVDHDELERNIPQALEEAPMDANFAKPIEYPAEKPAEEPNKNDFSDILSEM